MPALIDVLEARLRLAGRIRRTPLAHSRWLSDLTGGDIWLKLECLQLTGSFKVRGALNALLAAGDAKADIRHSTLDARGETGAPGPSQAVVTASAGNHGRAVAYAAGQLGWRAVVFTPEHAPRAKRDAIRQHGADLRTCPDYDAAEREAKAYSGTHGAAFLSAYSDPGVIAGAGTIGLEVLHEQPAIDAIVVPVGGGGLASGVGIAVRTMAPEVEVIGVEAAASTAFHTSLARGQVTEIVPGPTIADGLAGNLDPDTITFDLVRRSVSRIVLASEEGLARAIRDLAGRERLIAEGAGIAGVAALLSGGIELKGRRAAIVVSGSNIDLEALTRILKS
jgi:threonine dehydratase